MVETKDKLPLSGPVRRRIVTDVGVDIFFRCGHCQGLSSLSYEPLGHGNCGKDASSRTAQTGQTDDCKKEKESISIGSSSDTNHAQARYECRHRYQYSGAGPV